MISLSGFIFHRQFYEVNFTGNLNVVSTRFRRSICIFNHENCKLNETYLKLKFDGNSTKCLVMELKLNSEWEGDSLAP